MQLHVLGPLEAVRDGAAVHLSSQQQRRVLIALALAPGRIVSNDRLMTALWGEAWPASALKSLRAHVSRLRDALHDDDGRIVATGGNGYVLRIDADAIDAVRFERLTRRARQVATKDPRQAVQLLDAALALWRGPAFADVADEPFARPDAVRLEELRRAATEDRLEALLACGRNAQVAAEAEAFARRHPLRERPQRQLMLALYRQGRQADALDAYHRFRERLADELGLQPSASLRALQRDILNQAPGLEAGAPPAGATATHAGAAAPNDLRSWRTEPAAARGPAAPLLERDAELATLASAATAVAGTRHGRVVIVRGEAGIGKTALIRRSCDDGPLDRVLWGSCDPLFTPRPLGPLRDIAGAVGPAFDDLLRAGAGRHDVADALIDELGRSAPTTLVLEDLQWADEATLDVVRLLARRAAGLPVLLVLSLRDDQIDGDPALRRVLGELTTLPRTTQLQLGPLSSAAVATLAAPHGRDGERIHAATDGNPLFVVEVLASPGDDVPGSIVDAVVGRAAELDARARTVLEVIAVAPPRAEPWLLDAVAGGAADGLAACLATGMLVDEPGGVAFRHELVRRAVETAIPPHRRRMLHERVLAALSVAPAGAGDLPRLAHHADAADSVEAVLRVGPGAARDAADVGAHREAAAYYGRVLRHGDRLAPQLQATMLRRYADACLLSDRPDAAIGAVEQIVQLHRRHRDPRSEAEALGVLSRLLWEIGRTVEAMALARKAVRILEDGAAGAQLAVACVDVARLALAADDVGRATAWSTRALETAAAVGAVAADIAARVTLATIAGLGGDPDVDEQFDRCLRAAEAADLHDLACRALVARTACGVRRHHYRAAARAANAAEERCRAKRDELALFHVHAHQALIALDLGDLERAAELSDLVIARPRGATIPRILALTVRGLIAARTGRGDPRPALDEAERLAAPTGELGRLAPPALARAETAWIDGRSGAIAPATDTVHDLARERGARWVLGPLAGWRLRAGLACPLPDDVAEPYLLQAAGRHREAADWWRAHGCDHQAALSLLDAGDVADAVASLREIGATAVADRAERQRGEADSRAS